MNGRARIFLTERTPSPVSVPLTGIEGRSEAPSRPSTVSYSIIPIGESQEAKYARMNYRVARRGRHEEVEELDAMGALDRRHPADDDRVRVPLDDQLVRALPEEAAAVIQSSILY